MACVITRPVLHSGQSARFRLLASLNWTKKRSSTAGASEVRLLDGTTLPCETIGSSRRGPLVWAHGLGPQEPWNMNRRTCESYGMIAEASCGPSAFSAVLYDARGHGDSAGWEDAAHMPAQFHWRNLAVDMLFVADRHGVVKHGALLGGYSMGASTAVWAAYQSPTYVRGLVLLSVTTAWEIRAARRGYLLDTAKALEEAGRSAAAGVVRGAAVADLPDLEDLRRANLSIPVLLSCSRDDPTHPADVIERLATAFPNATTLITNTTEELKMAFPAVLKQWMCDHEFNGE